MDITIQKLKQRYERIQMAKTRVGGIKLRIEENKIKLCQSKEQLEKEKQDVEELQHLSIAYVCAILSGSKEIRLSKETQEAIEAQLRYDQLRAKDHALRSEYRKLCLFIDEEAMILRKLNEVQRDTVYQQNQEICIAIDKKIEENRAMDWKIEDTIDTIQLISRRLDVAFDHLDETFLFDLLIESGNLTKTMKHNKLMDIQDELESIRLDILRLKEEFQMIRTYEFTNLHIPFDLMLQDYGLLCGFFSPEYKIHKNVKQVMHTIHEFQRQLQEEIVVLQLQRKNNEMLYEGLQQEYAQALQD